MKKTIAIHLTCAGLLFTSSFAVQADDGEFFDSGFLFRPGNQDLPTDLSIFSHSNKVLPGPQQVKIIVNQRNFGEHTVTFIPNEQANKDATPCFTLPLLQAIGIKTVTFPEHETQDNETCVDLSILPSATYNFDASTATLTLSIPQIALDSAARGSVPMSLWNDGETSLWATYQLSHYRGTFKDNNATKQNNNSTFFGLQAGFNVGAWRFRSNGSLYRTDGEQHWNFNENYIERDIPHWRSRIRFGDNTTTSTTFTATRIRGVKLESDDSMLANSEQGYAPTVEGFANSTAKVTIRQNGNVMYTTMVAPGPFVINDLYAIPGGGDLEVEIEETNGQVVRYIQPYSILPSMLREGRWQYSASVGKYRAYSSDTEEPIVAQATFAHGLPAGVTLYGGTMISKNYFANSLGIALNLSDWGGLSADLIHSTAKDQDGERLSGYAMRVQYAKNLQTTGTNLRLFGYRYSSANYRDLSQILTKSQIFDPQNPSSAEDFYQSSRLWSKSHEYQASITQNLGEYGSLSASYSKIQFRNNMSASNSFNIGYGNSIGSVSYYISYNSVSSAWQSRNNSVMLNISIPLEGTNSYAGYSYSRQTGGNYSHDATLSGSLLENNALTYNVRAGRSKDDSSSGNNYYLSSSYRNSIGEVSASVARMHKNTQSQISVSGSLVIDQGGILLGQHMTDTAIIVDAPGAANMQLASHPTIRTNSSGRALIPYASPYRENQVSLSPDYYNENVTVQQNHLTVVPTKGAIVVASFETEAGRSELFTLKYQGKIVPFGAAIYDPEGERKAIIGPIGRLWMSGLVEVQKLTARWGTNGESRECSFTIDPATLVDTTEDSNKELTCE